MNDKVNVLLVDDQPGKLLANEEILRSLGENLIKASSAREALEFLLKNEVAVVLIDVCMPELDGFQLAAMIRDHPRFEKTAIIFISAVQVDDVDRLRGYAMGAVDYVPVPVIPEVLRAKVKVFAELYRKTRQLERLNFELERRVAERTAELVASNGRLLASEQGRSLALAAGQMGSWDWDLVNGDWIWDEGQCRIFGVDHASFRPNPDNVGALVDPQDLRRLNEMIGDFKRGDARGYQTEFRVMRPDGAVRWCFGTAAPTVDERGQVVRVSGVTIDITDRREAEQRQDLLAREVDHRARNALAVVQSIVRLTRAQKVDDYVAAVEGRIKALARAHALLSESRWHGADIGALVEEELAPYRGEGERITIGGPNVSLLPHMAQGLALALHELATNAAKHGALSSMAGKVSMIWQQQPELLVLHWIERGGPRIVPPSARSFGLKVIRASIEQQLGGKAMFEWHPTGLQCTLSIPQGETISRGEGKKARAGTDGGASRANMADSRRVLLVEDEALVAMMIQEFLGECGRAVVGPIGTAAEALATARQGDFDGAILDINLGDGMAYPVAEILSARGVPFVFLTGYEADTVDDRFSDVPILQKPIERQMLQRIFLPGVSASAAARRKAPRAVKAQARS